MQPNHLFRKTKNKNPTLTILAPNLISFNLALPPADFNLPLDEDGTSSSGSPTSSSSHQYHLPQPNRKSRHACWFQASTCTHETPSCSLDTWPSPHPPRIISHAQSGSWNLYAPYFNKNSFSQNFLIHAISIVCQIQIWMVWNWTAYVVSYIHAVLLQSVPEEAWLFRNRC